MSCDCLFILQNVDRSITIPLAWYPRLMSATVSELQNWRLIGKGCSIHWEEIGEDILVEDLLLGKPSG